MNFCFAPVEIENDVFIITDKRDVSHLPSMHE